MIAATVVDVIGTAICSSGATVLVVLYVLHLHHSRQLWKVKIREGSASEYRTDHGAVRVVLVGPANRYFFFAEPLRTSDPEFDTKLHETISDARARAIALDTAEKSARRALPRKG